MATSLEKIAARLRSNQYADTDALAKDLATALSQATRQPSFSRGLLGGVIAGPAGGTTLDVGDPSAGRISKSLQAPQRGLPLANGALSVRSQANVEIQTLTVPATVMSCTIDTVGSKHTMTTKVILAGDEPYITKDSKTGVNSAGSNPFDKLSDASAAQTTIVSDVSGSQTAFTVGQIVHVSVTKQWDVRTTWARKDGRNIAIVNRTQKVDALALPVLAPVPQPTGCSPMVIAEHAIANTDTPGTPPYYHWPMAPFTGAIYPPGRFYLIFYTKVNGVPSYPSTNPYYAPTSYHVGIVNPDGTLSSLPAYVQGVIGDKFAICIGCPPSTTPSPPTYVDLGTTADGVHWFKPWSDFTFLLP